MSLITVRVPGPLRSFTGGADELQAPSGTVGEIMQGIGERHPQLLPRLLTAEGELRPHVNVFVGRANIRGLQGLSTPVAGGEIVSILPAVAGG
jgi:molybdopterin converting factor small subunit